MYPKIEMEKIQEEGIRTRKREEMKGQEAARDSKDAACGFLFRRMGLHAVPLGAMMNNSTLNYREVSGGA